MSLKVADLFATLTLESHLDKDVADEMDEAGRKGRTEAVKAGKKMGDGLSDGVEDGTRRVHSGMRSMLGNLGPMLAAGGVLLGAKLFGGMLSRGTELEAMRSKVSTVFEDSADDVRKWADANNEAFGVSKQDMAGMAAGVADLMKPLGFSAAEAAKMSKETLNMAGALSAWTGGKVSAAEATDVLNKAVLGETDGLVALGVKLSGDEVTQRTKDIMAQTGATEGIAKAQAVQQLVMEKSADAQKAWNGHAADGVKNSNTLKAKLADLKDTIAEKLQPVFAKVIEIVKDQVIPWFERLGTSIKPAIDSIIWALTTKLVPAFLAMKDAAIAAIGWLIDHKEILIGVGVAVVAMLVPAFVAWATSAGAAAVATIAALAPIIAIGAAIAALVAGIIWAYNNWDFFRNAVDAVATFLTDTLWPALKAIGSFLFDVLVGAIKWTADAFMKYLWPGMQMIASFVMDKVVPAIGTLISWLGAIASKIIDVAAWIGAKVSDIVGFIIGLPGRIASTISSLWNGLTDGITSARNWVEGKINEVVMFAIGLPGRISNSFSGMWDGIKDAFRGALNWIIDKWNDFGFKFPTIDVPLIGKVGGWSFDTPNIPRFHTGGVVPGTPGREVGAMLMPGETVRTTSQERALQAALRSLSMSTGGRMGGAVRSLSSSGGVGSTSAGPAVSGGPVGPLDGAVLQFNTNASPDEIGESIAWKVDHSGR